ncbi:mannitol 1-phosphate dehydrogenase [Durotheca rogersii]|uniref:mannitol 1-phosphate dehydrogenase n=1 Tax=Durotheca rogersii TaxID=419775 RepID=UPI00221F1C21|nr:mannitol 1-phosphate dehydrogenase [Durotheca rogersii]KAI5861688.1 mannitol 1-phosphate dehydrogenase [Durotheca rogersii]
MMESLNQNPPSIAILGAGIGGLALAIGLFKRNVPVTIYEAADRFSMVGAGIGLGPNSLNAMDLIDPRFRREYDKVKTANEKPDFEHSIFDALYAEQGFGEKRGWTRGLIGAPYFTRSSAHRKDLLEIMDSFIDHGSVRFGKRAESVEQQGDKVLIRFRDGEVATVDAVVGCDGVKGITRRTVLSDIAPEEVQPTFCGMYIYRGIVPMDKAKEILGAHAGDAKFFMSQGKAVAVYPISQGREENFVFFVTDPKSWLDGDTAIPCTKEEMIADLDGFDDRLLRLLDYARPLRWPTWHHPKTSSFYNGRVCLLGDVAHACTPHQAAGAGQGLEDAAILSHLLALVKTPAEIEPAFRAYDAVRRPRAQKVVLTSYEAGIIYTWQHPEIGSDMDKLVINANQRLHWIWQHDLRADAAEAERQFRRWVAPER